jgi:hypothetical protein
MPRLPQPFPTDAFPIPVREFRTIWDDLRFWLPRRPTVRILVVVDGSVQLDANGGFGVGKVIEILRKNAPHGDAGFNYVNFVVETATRDAAPLAGVADYENFRFDQQSGGQPLLHRFDQVWCFGFHPGNTGNPSDTPIDAHSTVVSPGELAALTTWMNERKGGVLAMGDHHFLGATMAWKIPRVRAMRRWTNDQGVPPINGPITSPGGPTRYRHDTNQPQNSAQAVPGGASIPNTAEQDGIPQTIEVRNFGRFRGRPHPVLCGGSLGRIDVLPDHPHEGWIYEDGEVDGAQTYDFGNGVAGLDFPAAVDGGSKPMPQAIAWANPYPEPPYNHAKEPTPVERFAVIGAYDGHRADIGRVVVDSTWHHWFNMNLDGIEAAASGGTPEQVDNWAKVKTYFRNCAVWLSPPTKQRSMLTYAAFWSIGTDVATENYDGGMPSWELGESARDILGQSVNQCTLYGWLYPFIPLRFRERFEIPFPGPECLTCPPFELIENAVLGGMIKTMLPEYERLVSRKLAGKTEKVDVKAVVAGVEKGGALGLTELQKFWTASLEHAHKDVAELSASNDDIAKMMRRDAAGLLEELTPDDAGKC